MRLVNNWDVKDVFRMYAETDGKNRLYVNMNCAACGRSRTVRADHLKITCCLHCDGVKQID